MISVNKNQKFRDILKVTYKINEFIIIIYKRFKYHDLIKLFNKV